MTKVLFITNIFDAGISEGLSHFLRIVRRAVVHYEHFKVTIALTKYGINALPEQMRELIARDNETDGGNGNHKPVYFLWRSDFVDDEEKAVLHDSKPEIIIFGVLFVAIGS